MLQTHWSTVWQSLACCNQSRWWLTDKCFPLRTHNSCMCLLLRLFHSLPVHVELHPICRRIPKIPLRGFRPARFVHVPVSDNKLSAPYQVDTTICISLPLNISTSCPCALHFRGGITRRTRKSHKTQKFDRFRDPDLVYSYWSKSRLRLSSTFGFTTAAHLAKSLCPAAARIVVIASSGLYAKLC